MKIAKWLVPILILAAVGFVYRSFWPFFLLIGIWLSPALACVWRIRTTKKKWVKVVAGIVLGAWFAGSLTLFYHERTRKGVAIEGDMPIEFHKHVEKAEAPLQPNVEIPLPPPRIERRSSEFSIGSSSCRESRFIARRFSRGSGMFHDAVEPVARQVHFAVRLA